MTTSIFFAHITDVHVSERAQPFSTVSTLAPQLLAEAVQMINGMPDLDFVMITGDVIDTASRSEVEKYNAIISNLDKPWHFIPGNHDGFVDLKFPGAFLPDEAVVLIDPRMAEPTPYAQHSAWSRAVADGIQLIGLDSRLAEDWSGIVSEEQLGWLRAELDQHVDDLVILAVHHPLHALGEHNFRGRFTKFICTNGAEVEALLDSYPNVKLVLSGHHHANHLSLANGQGRLHICTTALSGYQCIFRTIRLTQSNAGWHAHVQTHSTARPEDLQHAYEVAMADSMAREYNPENPAAWVDFCAGRPEDLNFDGLLG
jgi:3',5'-cyclic AMP phosphodiesterase CpdA